MNRFYMKARTMVLRTGIGKKLRYMMQMRSYKISVAEKYANEYFSGLSEAERKDIVADMMNEAKTYNVGFDEYIMYHFRERDFNDRRLFIPTNTEGEKYFSGQAFYCCERPLGIDYTTQNWRETDQYEKSTNGIVGKRDNAQNGIAFVAKGGIHECAAYNDEDQTLSVTLSRSFSKTFCTNGEIRGQINGHLSYEFAIAVLDESVSYCDLLRLQDTMANDFLSSYVQKFNGVIQNNQSLLKAEGSNIVVSIIKLPEDNAESTLIIRTFNASGENSKGILSFAKKIIQADEVNLNEEFICSVDHNENSVMFELSPWKIATFKIKVELDDTTGEE